MKKEYEGPRPPTARYLVLPLLAIVLLQGIGLLVPAELSWGFNFWHLVSAPWNYIILAGAMFLITPTVNRRVATFAEPLLISLARLVTRLPKPAIIAAFTPLLFAIFYFVRSEALVYGDGFMVLKNHTDLSHAIDLSLYYLKPLTISFDRAVYWILSSFIDAQSVKLLAVNKALGGVVGFLALYRMSRLLVQEITARWLILLGTLTSGAVLLFFGHIENYTWATAISLWSLAFSIGYLCDKNASWPAVVSGILACGFHLLSCPFLIIAVFAPAFKKSELFIRIRFRWIIVGTVLLSSLTVYGLKMAGLSGYLVAIWPAKHGSYWAMSTPHLLDMVNQVFLMAPLGIFLLLFVPQGQVGNKQLRVDRLVATTAMLAFLVSFWIDPSLGAPRDWDLLSFFGFPLSLLGAYRLARWGPGQKILAQHLAGVVVIGIVCITPNLIEKNDLKLATARLDNLLWHDAHYQAEYRQAERCLPWSYTLRAMVGEKWRAIKYLHRRGMAAEDDFWVWLNLSELFVNMRMHDSAYFYVNKSVAIVPANADRQVRLSVNSTVANLLFRMNRFPEALPYFRRTFTLDPTTAEHSANLGFCFITLGQYDSACYYFEWAMPLIAEEPMKLACGEELIHCALAMGELQKAHDVLRLMIQLEPGSSRIRRLRDAIESWDQDTAAAP